MVEIEFLLANILNQFESYYKQSKTEIINDWLNECIHINKEIKFHQNQDVVTAIFKGIRENGEGIININGQDTVISGGMINL